ncbi:hypothetical protein H0H81_004831 [Sphagnurus paluster]|uniref:Uncharacterized protein n=1 Tax=Sphagnurus paluster TaxID=117069 RepID=A0A9P7K735_9AGAR|nr:hypothetical protein H0H81_004831 [Sphagnurus paluster]
MAGKPFKVGRFAHTLRVRLMREHLGVDVDAMDEQDLMANGPVKPEFEQTWDPDAEQAYGKEEGVTQIKKSKQRTAVGNLFHDTLEGVQQVAHATKESAAKPIAKVLDHVGLTRDSIPQNGDETLIKERMMFTREGKEVPGFTSSIVPTLEEKVVAEQLSALEEELDVPTPRVEQKPFQMSPRSQHSDQMTLFDENASQPRTSDGALFGAPAGASKTAETDEEPPHALSGVNDADNAESAAPEARSHIRRSLNHQTWTLQTPRPKVDPEGFEDPISDAFWNKMWVASAVHNTEIYRRVFHAVPDDLITTWKQYKDFIIHHDRLTRMPQDRMPSEPATQVPSEDDVEETEEGYDEEMQASKESFEASSTPTPTNSASNLEKEAKPKRYAKGTEPFEKWEREEMEQLLKQTNGHLGMIVNCNAHIV